MERKIYIIPNTGRYEGKLLILDHVESMTHISNSRIAKHPVESMNKSVADHRFREAKVIQMSGNVSDAWDTEITLVPTPVFQTMTNRDAQVIREQCAFELGADSPTCILMNKVLDNVPTLPIALELLLIPSDEFYWITTAEALVKAEKDKLAIAKSKSLSLTGGKYNSDYNNGSINTVQQTREMINELDREGTFVTIVSMFESYHNMVMKSYTNPLRNGVERGAYWVDLVFEEQLTATTVTNPIVLQATASEEVVAEVAAGKTSPVPVPKTDASYKTIDALVTEELAIKSRDNSKINTYMNVQSTNRENLVNIGLKPYLIAPNETGLSRARMDIRGRIATIESVKGVWNGK